MLPKILSNKTRYTSKFPLVTFTSLLKKIVECSVCLSVLSFIALIASLLRPEGQTDKQSINFKEGEIKCCKEIKITAPPNEWQNIPDF